MNIALLATAAEKFVGTLVTDVENVAKEIETVIEPGLLGQLISAETVLQHIKTDATGFTSATPAQQSSMTNDAINSVVTYLETLGESVNPLEVAALETAVPLAFQFLSALSPLTSKAPAGSAASTATQPAVGTAEPNG